MPVYKVGRTTGLTHGTVFSDDVVMGGFGYDHLGSCTFTNVFSVIGDNDVPFATEGDSGSLIINSDGDAVGLLFGGVAQPDGRWAVLGCHIQDVLQTLKVKLITKSGKLVG
jgi:hypothetical protein